MKQVWRRVSCPLALREIFTHLLDFGADALICWCSFATISSTKTYPWGRFRFFLVSLVHKNFISWILHCKICILVDLLWTLCQGRLLVDTGVRRSLQDPGHGSPRVQARIPWNLQSLSLKNYPSHLVEGCLLPTNSWLQWHDTLTNL